MANSDAVICWFVDAQGKRTGRVGLWFHGEWIEPAVNVPNSRIGWQEREITDELFNRWFSTAVDHVRGVKKLIVG